ncbi:MAG TPA: hypothetical protein VGQ83_33040 [Polyangia bacterium]
MDDRAVLARYPVKTPTWVWAALLATLAASGGLLVYGLPALGGGGVGLLVLAAVAGLPGLALWASRPYRVGAPSIDVYPECVDIPAPWRGRVRFELGTLRVARTRVMQEVTVMHLPTGVVLDRGEIVTFRGTRRRQLSDRVFRQPAELGHLVADLHAVACGQAPLGPDGWRALEAAASACQDGGTPPAPRATDQELEARLDAELRGEP